MAISGQRGSTLSAKRSDPRVLRTRAALLEALMQLLHQKDWGEITTSDICRRAGVARSSLYEHISGKGEILDEIFAAHMGEICITGGKGDPLCTLDWLVGHIAQAPDFFARAVAGRRGDTLLPRFRAALTRKLEEELSARAIPEPGPKAAYLIGGSLAYLGAAPEGGTAEALQKMAAQVIG
jgi:AcrR family transcriptional regulator